MRNQTSHLVLPRVDVDALIKHGIHVCRVRVRLLKVLFIHLQAEGLRLVEYLPAVEVLVSRFREAGIGPTRQRVLRGLTLRLLMLCRTLPFFAHFLAEDLRLRTEILLLVLREVVDRAVFAMQRTKVLVIVGVVVVIEAEHAFFVLGLASTLSRNTTLLKDGANLGGVQVLQLVEVNTSEQILLLVCQRAQIVLPR